MPAPTQPSEIAREVLRLLAARRLPPTPDNYRRLYDEVSGTWADDVVFPESYVKSLARQLPRDTPERQRLTRLLDHALADGKRDAAREALTHYLDSLRAEEPPAWNELIANLLRQWEARHLGWTTARKRESLERVLAANDPATLHARLQGLVGSWARAPADPEFASPRATAHAVAPLPVPPSLDVSPSPSPSATSASTRAASDATAPSDVRLLAPTEAGDMLRALRELLRLAMESLVPALLHDEPELGDELAGFARSIGAADDVAALDVARTQLRKFAYRLERVAGDRAETHAGVVNLLRLLLENIDEIVIDDSWLRGQVEALRDVIAKPTDVRLIDDAERHLKELIYKQSQLKHSHSEAQRSLKETLAGLVDHLAGFTETTSRYHDHIGRYANRISRAHDISELGDVLNEVMRDTLEVRDEARRSRDELQAARERAREAETRIAQLQQELDESSRLMRHDQLTGVLNRRGLEDSFDKEAARARRHRLGLSVAVLDVDNFKQLNDTWGHHAGDDALIHLAAIMRKNLRPHDTLARYGGEEFVLLYPEASLDQAAQALVRLQRELTRALFLFDDNKILITFSAGVTEWADGEALERVLERADRAMYEAKHSGKNKVVATPAN